GGIEPVVPAAAEQPVVAGAAGQRIVAGAAPENVVAEPAKQAVVAGQSDDGVILTRVARILDADRGAQHVVELRPHQKRHDRPPPQGREPIFSRSTLTVSRIVCQALRTLLPIILSMPCISLALR